MRYHFPDEVELDAREPVIIQKLLTGTSEFVQCGVAPSDIRDMELIRAYVRSTAFARGGEAWRAVTEDGDMLCVYSVHDRADELRGTKSAITLHPRDQLCLAIARLQLGVRV